MVVFEADRCKSCGICIAFCPRKCLAITEAINSKGYKIAGVIKAEACISCGTCYLVCPDTAISVCAD
jgi:2-oxoglutarate ferredoxin oxidoreductase subunit delta